MIWVVFQAVVKVLFWLIFPQKPKPVLPRIDPNEICPVCGNSDGLIRCVPHDMENANAAMGVTVQHTCKTCGAHWHTAPVTKDANEFVYP